MDIVVNRRQELQNISRGKAFTFSVYNADVDSTYNILIKTGVKPIEINNSLITLGSVKVEFYESGTYSDGSAVTVFNRNRNSSNIPLTTVKAGGTYSNTNATLLTTLISGGSGGGAVKTGGQTSREVFWQLKPSTDYVIVLTASAENSTINLSTEFEEV